MVRVLFATPGSIACEKDIWHQEERKVKVEFARASTRSDLGGSRQVKSASRSPPPSPSRCCFYHLLTFPHLSLPLASPPHFSLLGKCVSSIQPARATRRGLAGGRATMGTRGARYGAGPAMDPSSERTLVFLSLCLFLSLSFSRSLSLSHTHTHTRVQIHTLFPSSPNPTHLLRN